MSAADLWLKWLEENVAHWDTHALEDERMSDDDGSDLAEFMRRFKGGDKIAELKAQAAAMREALEHIVTLESGEAGDALLLTHCQQALASDAGKALLERLRRTEDLADGQREAAVRLQIQLDEAHAVLRTLEADSYNCPWPTCPGEKDVVAHAPDCPVSDIIHGKDRSD